MTRRRSQEAPSRHHTFWTAADYNRDPVTRRLRNDPRTHVVMSGWIHSELHRDIQPVGRPITEVGKIALRHLQDSPDRYTPVDHVKDLANFMYQYDEMLATNLDDQMPYLTLGVKALKRSLL